MTYRIRKTCAQLTMAGKACRRTGCWCLERGAAAIYCWHHACDMARNVGVTVLLHWITGERRAVPARADVVDESQLPKGRDAIVRALNAVRTRPAFHRARYALICDLRACMERGFIAPDVSLALARAKTRVGMAKPHPPLATGVRRR